MRSPWLTARDESGFSIVEVMIAFLLLVLAVLATFRVLDSSRRATYRAEQDQVLLNVAQREVEKLRALDYAKLALTRAPQTSSDPNSPLHRVASSNFDLADGGPPAAMVINGGALAGGGQVTGGVVDPGPTPFVSGDVSGKIYRFVVWRDDPNCGSAEFCGGTQDLKRVIVAVTLDSTAISSQHPYAEVQTNFTNPHVSALGLNPPPDSGVVTGQQFWLSDTPCSASADEPPRDPPSDHPTHDTLGTCSDTSKPDSLLASPPPPDPAPTDPDVPPHFDYSTELEPGCGAPNCSNADKGLQLVRPSTDGCALSSAATNPQAVHRWVSKPMPSGGFSLTGKATLELYTRTINDVPASGRICVFLFSVSPSGAVTPVQSPPDNSFTYSSSLWPTGSWKQVLLKMSFSETTIPAGDRLGLAMTLERAGTSGDVLEFSYDHPDDKTRLEVLTTTPLN